MATDRRRAAATATSGAVLTTAGGVLRHQGVHAANKGKIPSFDLRHPSRWAETHPTRALLRTGARGRQRYLLGAALGLAGAPALAVGLHDTFSRREVASKRDRQRSFVEEGLRGTSDALAQRAESIKEVPPQHRAGPLAVSALAGAGGSLATHRALDRMKAFHNARHGSRAGLAALGGTTVAALSYPLARHTVRSSEYEVTPSGVRRKKKRPVRPSSKASRDRGTPRSFTADLSKSMPELPMGNIPRQAYHRSHGAVRVMAYHGGGRFTVLTRNDRQVLAHRDDLSFRKGRVVKADLFTMGGTIVSCGREGNRMVMRNIPVSEEQRNEVIRQAYIRRLKAEGKPLPLWATPVPMDAIRMHTRAERAVRQKRDARGRFTKADYAGRRTSTKAQRAAILAAGSTPVIGGVAGARTAGHFAPPGERLHTETRQYGLTTAGSVGGGLAGAYGTAALAQRHSGVAQASEKVADLHNRAGAKVRNLKPVNATIARLPKGGRAGQLVARGKTLAAESKVAAPLRRAPAAALAGYVAGKTVGGLAGSAMAMHRNQGDQREYNLKHPVVKYVDNMTVAERRKLSRKKRYAAASSTTTGVLGLGALAARAKKRPDLALNMLTGSAAIGGVNNLNFAGVLRREAKAQDPRHVNKADRRKEPLTRMRADQAAEIVRRHGDAGPLPSNLSRPERMQAYEARYVHAGGHKGEKWQRRADVADKVKVAGLAGATAGGAGIMALRHPAVARRLGSRSAAARHATDTATIGAATVSGAGELYAGHARRRRSSYSNSKAGVAASALRRMRDYQA